MSISIPPIWQDPDIPATSARRLLAFRELILGDLIKEGHQPAPFVDDVILESILPPSQRSGRRPLALISTSCCLACGGTIELKHWAGPHRLPFVQKRPYVPSLNSFRCHRDPKLVRSVGPVGKS